ncbi:MAG: Tyrosine recombinase XerD [Chroococcidiopsis sp. SAG 2025]|uniref:tyrosine-type recombinase/integrase n=1 Tax=Chroococcidiopsis sp. SAG 2025 TaxID=171389 RepID=UPI0029378FF8|nr:Tyrosine recombinase XerD [Chroococcidiopsis sp. SAG 2025]
MNKAIAPLSEPIDLALSVPLPLTQHPAAVYLSQLAPKSRRTMRQSLNAIASMLTNGQCDALTLDWSKLRYQHTAALLAVFKDKYAPATANRMLSALRRVLKEARRLKLMDADDYDSAVDFKGIKSAQLLRGRALSEAEISALLSACMDDPTPKGARDAAMISILMAGLRRSEVVNLDETDFDPKTGGLTIRRGKGMKDRITYLPTGAAAAVEDWLAIRGDEPGPLLYPVDKAGQFATRRLTDQAVMFVLQKRAAESGVAAFSPHDFRRTFITELLETGADVITVSRLAGHADPATTAKYDMRSEEVKRLAVAKLKVPYRPRRPLSG